MTKPALLVLAAGMGSRYGGLKQLDQLGPNGETIMDYSVRYAIEAGYGKIVYVIRRNMEADFREHILSKYIGQIPVEYVFQELDLLRERAFFTDSNVNLSLRPYCLDDEAKDSECAYGKFMDRVKNLHRLEKKFGRKNMNRLRESYLLGNLLFAEEVRLLKDRGTDLEEMLGTPFYRDENRNTYATWYDALQVLPFIPEAGPGREDDSK